MAAKKKTPGKAPAKAKAKSGAKTKTKTKASIKSKASIKRAVSAKSKTAVKKAAASKSKPAGKPAAAKKAKAPTKTMTEVPMKKSASGKSGLGAVKVLTIRQTASFAAEPAVVYEMIMDEAKHAAFTGAPASISREKLGTFSAHGGYCTGVHMELIEGKRIVQTWRGSDWPEGHFSIATFDFEAVPGGTDLTFTQVGVPEMHYVGIESGWNEHYWQPMKEMLEGA